MDIKSLFGESGIPYAEHLYKILNNHGTEGEEWTSETGVEFITMEAEEDSNYEGDHETHCNQYTILKMEDKFLKVDVLFTHHPDYGVEWEDAEWYLEEVLPQERRSTIYIKKD